MSEELRDEVEAINSIYGDGCLVPSSDSSHAYILTPPGESSSLRLEFPPEYPAEPPLIVGTHSSREHGRKGDAARELSLFREVVGTVYQPGMVCLFDAIEELARRLEENAELEQLQREEEEPAHEEGAPSRREAQPPTVDVTNMPEPPWTLSDPVLELRSAFIARAAPVSSTAEAEGFVQHLLATDKKVRAATHNITAWRIRGPNNTSFQDCDDDGETAAGGRLLHLLQLMDLWDIMVVVTRWYGGQKLGPRRFALINQVARDAFVKAGLVADAGAGKKKGPGK